MALVEIRAMVLSIVMVIFMGAMQISYAALYKVGDSAGWTTLGNIDYRKWSATKNFQVGDIISKFSLHLHAFLQKKIMQSSFQEFCALSSEWEDTILQFYVIYIWYPFSSFVQFGLKNSNFFFLFSLSLLQVLHHCTYMVTKHYFLQFFILYY